MWRREYRTPRSKLIRGGTPTCSGGVVSAHPVLGWLGQYMAGTSRTKRKESRPLTHTKVDGARFAHFNVLWDQINRDPRMHFELDTPAQISLVLQRIAEHFSVLPLTVSVTHQQGVHKLDEHARVESTIGYYQVCSQKRFARRFCSGACPTKPACQCTP